MTAATRDLRARLTRAGIPLLAAVAVLGARPSQAVTITFDDTTGLPPVSFDTAIPGGQFGPHLDYGSIILDGGIIALATSPSDQAATTLPNLYATSDFQPLANLSLLPGVITGQFPVPASSVSFSIGNGNTFPATFTLTAYNGASVVAQDVVVLGSFGPSGFVGALSVAAAGITSFAVTSSQPTGSINFMIDTVEFALVPEPGTAALLSAGMGMLAARSRRRAPHGAIRKARPQLFTSESV